MLGAAFVVGLTAVIVWRAAWRLDEAKRVASNRSVIGLVLSIDAGLLAVAAAVLLLTSLSR